MRVSLDELVTGCEAFEKRERRDAMYRVATELIQQSWGDGSDVADALGVLLLTWNQAFYGYGVLDFDELETLLQRRAGELATYRERDLGSFTPADGSPVQSLFFQFLEATRLTNAKSGEVRRSPVSVAKALPLLAPSFFPPWDDEIAKRYGCDWSSATGAAECYMRFMDQVKMSWRIWAMRRSAGGSSAGYPNGRRFPKALLKLVDEYNYAHFTKGMNVKTAYRFASTKKPLSTAGSESWPGCL